MTEAVQSCFARCEKKYMLTKRLIVHAKIAEMKRASQKNFLRLVLMKKVGLQIIMCKRK